MRKRILKYLTYKGISKYKFYQETGLSNGYLDKDADLNIASYEKISSCYTDLNMDWVRTGEGEMLKSFSVNDKTEEKEKNLIPFYSNVISVGGINERLANVDDTQTESVDAQMIDTGDWFRSATSAIVQYGDSMVEYPHGSILAVRRLTDMRNITTGKSYVIETSDFRVTKQLVDADPKFFMAYSTNTELRPDGTLVHAPFKIYKELIRHIDVVLGCVSIEDSI
nr:hypothetical protein [uncultured Porphyromonas sp.]